MAQRKDKNYFITGIIIIALMLCLGCTSTDTEYQPTTEENTTGAEEEITGPMGPEEDIDENVTNPESESEQDSIKGGNIGPKPEPSELREDTESKAPESEPDSQSSETTEGVENEVTKPDSESDSERLAIIEKTVDESTEQAPVSEPEALEEEQEMENESTEQAPVSNSEPFKIVPVSLSILFILASILIYIYQKKQ